MMLVELRVAVQPEGAPVAARVTVVELRVAVQPEGAPVAARVTVPVKPFTGATVIVDVAEEPALKLIDVGLAVTV